MKSFLSLLNKSKIGLYISWVGQLPIVYVLKPEFLESILQSNIHVDKAGTYEFLKPWLGNGLITAPVEKWYRHRKILTPTFHFNILEQYAVIMSEKTEIIIKSIEEKIAKNATKVIDIFPFMQNVTFNVICETMMGVNIDDEEIASYRLAINRYIELHSTRVYQSWLWIYDWIYFLTPQGKKYKAAINSMHSFTDEVIRKKKLERMQNNQSQNKQDDSDTLDKRERKAFLDLLLDVNEKNGVSLTDKELRAHVDTFMFAGHDTTATSVSWALFCIGNDPKCQEKIHEELKEVFKDSQSPSSLKELSQLKYLERVIKESRRLYPSVPVVLRKISEEVKMDNYVIPKGTAVAAPIMLIHRNPAVWSDPLKFDPDRFLLENLKQIHPYAYIPFSAGPRNCIGQKFAIIEEKTILAAILRKWRVKSMQTHEEITLHNYIILRSSQGFIHLQLLPKK